MAREFISPNHVFSLADDLLAESTDHSMHINHIHYGTVPELTNNVITKHHWLLEEWHTFCGLSSNDSQEPIQNRRLMGVSASSLNQHKSFSVDVLPFLRPPQLASMSY